MVQRQNLDSMRHIGATKVVMQNGAVIQYMYDEQCMQHNNALNKPVNVCMHVQYGTAATFSMSR